MKIRYNLDTKSYSQKPTTKEAGAIRVRLCAADHVTETEPEELLDAIENGQTFTPGEMTGTTSDTWQSQQIIVADIDNDKADKSCISQPLVPDVALSLLSFHSITPYCMYYSFSHRDTHPKYRVVVILSEPIRDAAEAVDLTKRLTAIFNGYTTEKCADTSIADAARFIYGSKPGSIFYKSGEVTSLEIMRNLKQARETNPPKQDTGRDCTSGLPADYRDFDREILLDALSWIKPDESYKIWIDCGMALKAEGYSLSDWESWSRRGRKFKEGECAKKWESFDTTGKITGGTIIYHAMKSGYKFPERSQLKSYTNYEEIPQPGDEDAPPESQNISVPTIPEKEKVDPVSQDTQPSSQEVFDEFMKEIESERFRPISTGIEQLDKALSGGLERKTLVTLAAAPGAGKTAIAQYLLENMAEKGHNVVYVNLEMDRSQLLSRSIARLSHEENMRQLKATPHVKNHLPDSIYADVDALTVRRGYKWTEEEKAIVEKTAAYYREHIAPRFQYVTTNPENKGSIDNTLSSIMGKLEAITADLIRQGQDAPLVCIDYLQFVEYDLMGENERKPDNAESIKQTLKAFKQYAMKHNTVVILITANNRASNSEGRASMDSARDTSNIEYSGDVMLSLVYTAVEERWLHVTGQDKSKNDKYGAIDNDFVLSVVDWTLRENDGKDVPLIAKLLSLKVVKGRGIRSRGAAKFVYDGRYFYFEPDTGHENPYCRINQEEPK